MVNWRVTATTIYCEAVDDEVTVMVFKEGSVKCTGCKKYTEPTAEFAREIQQKCKETKRQIKCIGNECRATIEYRDSLFTEEAKEK